MLSHLMYVVVTISFVVILLVSRGINQEIDVPLHVLLSCNISCVYVLYRLEIYTLYLYVRR
jgi:Na+-translocating ferredoxin:NAD+ oxidoreductase RnfE subunit